MCANVTARVSGFHSQDRTTLVELTEKNKPNKQMNESKYLSGEFTDEFLRAQADAGNYLLDEEGFQYRPTQDDMKKLALEGQSLLFIDCLKGK
jgi:hypothetical protein